MVCAGAPEDKLQRAKVFEVVGDKGVTEEFYYDGKEFGRRIYKPDGSLFSEKAMAVGVETDTESLDDRPIKVNVSIALKLLLLYCSNKSYVII